MQNFVVFCFAKSNSYKNGTKLFDVAHFKMDTPKAKMVFAYPVLMKLETNWGANSFEENETVWQDEVFVTYEEPNLYSDPYNTVAIKFAAVVMWLCGFAGTYLSIHLKLYFESI